MTLSLLAAVALRALPVPGSEPIHAFHGGAPGDRMGAAVAAAGDVDGDGLADVIVGAPHADPAGASSGEARVFSGRDGSLLLYLAGDAPGDWLGYAVAGAGDVDGDGRADVVVGAPLGTPPEGSAQLVSGRTGALLFTWTGDAPGDRFGHAVCGAGDVDGDGVPDVAVGAPLADAGGTFAGRVRVFSGAHGGALHTFDGAAWDQLGSAVDGAGDVDGDGRADLLVGAPLSDVGGFNAGSAYVFSGASGLALRAFHGAAAGDRLGSVVRGAGDVDADGVPDALLGIPAADAGAIDSGAVEVRSGADGSLLFVVAGATSGEFLQEGAPAGDVDRDGHADVLVGSSAADGAAGPEAGAVHLVSGATGAILRTFEGRAARDWFGAAVDGAGDANGDGRPDLLVGAPGHDDEPGKRGYAEVWWQERGAKRADPRKPVRTGGRRP